jgi:hypothetical protein
MATSGSASQFVAQRVAADRAGEGALDAQLAQGPRDIPRRAARVALPVPGLALDDIGQGFAEDHYVGHVHTLSSWGATGVPR